MKPFFKRHLAALLALLMVVALPTSVALAKYAQSMTVAKNINLFVGQKRKLIYNVNDGTWADHYTYRGKLLVAGQAYGELPGGDVVTRENCTFKGWYKNTDWENFADEESNRVDETSIISDEDTTIYAHWGGTWNVEIDANGGTLYVRDSNIIPGASESNPVKAERPKFNVGYYDGAYNMLLITAKKEGYQCIGYFDEPTGGTQVWQAGGNSVSGNKYYKNVDSPRGMLWLNNSVKQGTTFTFYPNWKANEYQIEYDANCENVEGTTKTSYHVYDEEAQLSKNGFSREGYTFKGWSTVMNPSVEDTIYKDEETVKNLTAKDGDVVILYAVWEQTASSDQDAMEPEDLSGLEDTEIQEPEDFGGLEDTEVQEPEDFTEPEDFDTLEAEDFDTWEADSFEEFDYAG